jgi:hypothetical protein
VASMALVAVVASMLTLLMRHAWAVPVVWIPTW